MEDDNNTASKLMNDEIKEIDITKDLYLCSPLLNTKCSKKSCYINNGSCCHTVNKEYSQEHLLDYITNLQQENLLLAKENEQEKQFIKDCGFENIQQLALDYIGIRQEKEDYKSRIEKAVEYIKMNCITSDTWEDLDFCNFVPTDNIKYKSLSANKVKNVIDILNGRSDK